MLAAETSRVEQRGGVLVLSARAAANCEMWREKVFIVASIRQSPLAGPGPGSVGNLLILTNNPRWRWCSPG